MGGDIGDLGEVSSLNGYVSPYAFPAASPLKKATRWPFRFAPGLSFALGFGLMAAVELVLYLVTGHLFP